MTFHQHIKSTTRMYSQCGCRSVVGLVSLMIRREHTSPNHKHTAAPNMVRHNLLQKSGGFTQTATIGRCSE